MKINMNTELLEKKVEDIGKKMDEIVILLKDENIGALNRIKTLEKYVYGNGKVGILEEIRAIKKENTKISMIVSSGITLTLQAVIIYIKHKLGW